MAHPAVLPEGPILDEAPVVAAQETPLPEDVIVAEVEKKIDAETHQEALVINIPGLFGEENDGIDYKNVDMDELDESILLGKNKRRL